MVAYLYPTAALRNNPDLFADMHATSEPYISYSFTGEHCIAANQLAHFETPGCR
jgi:hypothetical protein